jgi:hypothetical protein
MFTINVKLYNDDEVVEINGTVAYRLDEAIKMAHEYNVGIKGNGKAVVVQINNTEIH